MKSDKTKIGLVTSPIGATGITPLSNMLDILRAISDNIYVITGNSGYAFLKENKDIQVYDINVKNKTESMFTIILKAVYVQIKISYLLVKISKDVDLWIFFIGGESLLPAMIVAKLRRKPVLLALVGSVIECAEYSRISPLIKLRIAMIEINRILSTGIILYSEKFIETWGLKKHQDKISISHRHFLDFDKSKITKKIDMRATLVGYVGTLNEAKGFPNMLDAIPLILEKKDNIQFLIGGDGQLCNKVEDFLRKENLTSKVKFVGWIPHEKLFECLNELRLLVLPSYSEGLPNIVIEAMACGTPVLATPVGAIPDMIKDSENGFIMENNTPECIAENVIRALAHPDLGRIVENARVLVEQEFTYEAAVERYKKIIKGILGDLNDNKN